MNTDTTPVTPTLATLGLAIFGVLQAQQGKLVRYPLNFRLIK